MLGIFIPAQVTVATSKVLEELLPEKLEKRVIFMDFPLVQAIPMENKLDGKWNKTTMPGIQQVSLMKC